MKAASHYQSVIELLDRFFAEAIPPLDRFLYHFFRKNRYIGAKDRRKITSTIYKIIRNYYRFSWHIHRDGQIVYGRTLVLFYGFFYGDLKTFISYFSGEKYAPEPLTSDERAWVENLLKKGKPKSLTHKDMPEHICFECSEENFAYFDSHPQILEALKGEPSFNLRVNTLKISRAAMLSLLQKEGIRAEKTPYSPFGLHLKERIPLEHYDWFKKGFVEPQDEASQLAGLLVRAAPHETILDLCAGAGGKALLLAQMMENKGKLILSDSDRKRLERAKMRLRRAGISNYQIKPADEKKYFKRHYGAFDKLLVDAPCTGTGVWRRNPEARLRPLQAQLPMLLKTQSELLEKAAKLVRAGGQIIYTTCSLLKEENEAQIEAFLENHKDFKLKLINFLNFEPYNGNMCDMFYLKLDPANYNMDGFFGAVIERKAG